MESPNVRVTSIPLLFVMLFIFACALPAQDSTAASPDPLPPASVSEKWNFFTHETVTPVMLGGAAFVAAYSQTVHSTPVYGHAWLGAYPQRFGAAVGDIVAADFFGDFVFASAFHEDTRYIRRGSSHKFWPRVGYALTRSVVTRTDAGQPTFNWANLVGSAMSAGLSNAYYPEVSRTAPVAARNWGKSVGQTGLAYLVPEFWPDFRQWAKKHLFSRSH